MRLNKMLTALVFSSITLVSFAQNTTPKKYTISALEAVEIAFKNVVELKNVKLDSLLQWERNKEITGSALPTINGSISTQHFFAIPVTVLPDFLSPAVYGVLTQEGVRNGAGMPITAPNSYGTFPAQFGVPWQASAGFTVQQLLFQPDVFIGLKARATSMKYVSSNIDIMKDSIKSNVYRSYYAVLIGERRLKFLQDGIKRLEKLLHDQEAMYKQGFVEKLDIDKTQVSLNNLKTTETQVVQGVALGYHALKFALGLNVKDVLELSDSLSASLIKKDILELSNVVYENRPEMRLLNNVKALQELDLQRNKLQYIPTIAAFWNFSKNAQRQKFDFFGRGDWFNTSVVGVNMSIPIWNGGQRESKIRQARINLEKTNNTIGYIKNAIDLQQEAAKIQLTSALSNLDNQLRNIDLAHKVYTTTKTKYEQGLGSSFEILQVEQSLQDAENNYYISLYEAVVSKVALLKAVGKL
jgi:outer membrane protein TolC